VTIYAIQDIGRYRKFACTRRIVQGNDFELILAVNMDGRISTYADPTFTRRAISRTAHL